MPGQPAMGSWFAALSAATGASAEEPMVTRVMGHGDERVVRLSIQTNVIRHFVIRYQRLADGTITEAERCYTGKTSTY